MIRWISLLLVAIFPLSSTRPFIIERNGTTYALSTGFCQLYSCGADEGRGVCVNHIYSTKDAHFCQCNLPFTGVDCDDTLRLNATLPNSPYSECPFPLYCASVYGNGMCNEECNTSECLYDGYECKLESVCPENDYCWERFSDGICDSKCDREECQFDGGDCFSEMDTLPGQLLLRSLITAQDFMRLSHLFLFQLSLFLRTTVVLSHDSKGPIVWEWSAESGRGSRIYIGQNSTPGIEVSFSVDISHCTNECFDTIKRVEDFISESLAKQLSPVQSAAIVSVSSSLPSNYSSLQLLLAILIPIAILITILLGIVQHRRTRKRVLEAPVWHPPHMGEEAKPVINSAKKSRISPPYTTLLHEYARGTQPLNITSADDINARDESGRTPLLLAIQSKRNESDLMIAVDELLREGADINATDDDGWGVLHHAFHTLRSPNFNRWVMGKGASPMVVDEKGRSLIHIATENFDLPNLQLILQTEAARLIDSADYSNRIALSIAVCAHDSLSLSIARCLIENGANLNCDGDEQFDADVQQKFPLHLAVQFDSKEHVKLLIQKGCLVGVRDYRQWTALHYAVTYTGDVEMCRMVVDGGTEVDAVTDEGTTAEEMAAEWGLEEVRQYLVSVRGRNKPKRKRRMEKRYSSDAGYGSEESNHQLNSIYREMTTVDDRSDTVHTPPLPTLSLSPLQSFGISMTQSPLFNPSAFVPLTMMTPPTNSNYQSIPMVLTPSDRLLHGSTSSFTPFPLVPSPFPISSYRTPV